MMTGWELAKSKGIELDEIEAICVRLDGAFGEIPVDQAEAWLSRMMLFTTYDDPQWEGFPTPDRLSDFRFQIWTPLRLYFTHEVEGICLLSAMPRTPQHWTYVQSLSEAQKLIEIGTGKVWRMGEVVG